MNRPTPISLGITALFILVLSAAAIPAEAISCGACFVAYERCSTNCEGREKEEAKTACRIACENAAATCSCDDGILLRSEEVIERWPWLKSDKADACNSTTPCGSAFPSCAGWSGFTDCDDPSCGISTACRTCADGRCDLAGPATKQSRERFRVCFNAQAEPCTEYQRTSITLHCLCS